MCASSALFLAISLQGGVSFETRSLLPVIKQSVFQVRPNLSSPRPRDQVLFANDDGIKKREDCCPPIDQSDGPELLKPFLPALDPKYSVRGPVGEGKFLLSRSGPPTAEELSNEQMLQIVRIECSDLEVNTLVWKCLGYRFNEETESWDSREVFPNWKERFPTPPDLIGMQRIYSREVDQPSLRSNQALVRSIPPDNKQSLKTHLKPLGWRGYQVCCHVFPTVHHHVLIVPMLSSHALHLHC